MFAYFGLHTAGFYTLSVLSGFGFVGSVWICSVSLAALGFGIGFGFTVCLGL